MGSDSYPFIWLLPKSWREDGIAEWLAQLVTCDVPTVKLLLSNWPHLQLLPKMAIAESISVVNNDYIKLLSRAGWPSGSDHFGSWWIPKVLGSTLDLGIFLKTKFFSYTVLAYVFTREVMKSWWWEYFFTKKTHKWVKPKTFGIQHEPKWSLPFGQPALDNSYWNKFYIIIVYNWDRFSNCHFWEQLQVGPVTQEQLDCGNIMCYKLCQSFGYAVLSPTLRQ